MGIWTWIKTGLGNIRAHLGSFALAWIKFRRFLKIMGVVASIVVAGNQVYTWLFRRDSQAMAYVAEAKEAKARGELQRSYELADKAIAIRPSTPGAIYHSAIGRLVNGQEMLAESQAIILDNYQYAGDSEKAVLAFIYGKQGDTRSCLQTAEKVDQSKIDFEFFPYFMSMKIACAFEALPYDAAKIQAERALGAMVAAMRARYKFVIVPLSPGQHTFTENLDSIGLMRVSQQILAASDVILRNMRTNKDAAALPAITSILAEAIDFAIASNGNEMDQVASDLADDLIGFLADGHVQVFGPKAVLVQTDELSLSLNKKAGRSDQRIRKCKEQPYTAQESILIHFRTMAEVLWNVRKEKLLAAGGKLAVLQGILVDSYFADRKAELSTAIEFANQVAMKIPIRVIDSSGIDEVSLTTQLAPPFYEKFNGQKHVIKDIDWHLVLQGGNQSRNMAITMRGRDMAGNESVEVVVPSQISVTIR